MQQKYVEHYMAMAFHKWLMKISANVGDAPFRSVVQNFMYYQDPEEPSKVRLQSFITGLIDFVEKAKDMDDPDPAPPLVELELDARLAAKAQAQVIGQEVKLMRPVMDLATFNFKQPEKPLDKP